MPKRRLWWRWLLMALLGLTFLLALTSQWIRAEVILGKPFARRTKITLREDVVHIMWLTSDAKYDGWEFNVSGYLGSTRIERGRHVPSSSETINSIGYQKDAFVSHMVVPAGFVTTYILFWLTWFAWLPIGLELREERRRRHAGLCPKCRYPRIGLPDGAACPECGHRERLVEEHRSK